MKKMQLLLFLLSLFLFIGCNNTNSDKFATKSGKEILTQKNAKWYDIDSTQDRYAIYHFTSNQLTIERFKSPNFSVKKSEDTYPISFSDPDHFQLRMDGVTYNAEISRCNNDEFVCIYCTPNVSGLKPIVLCGWNSKIKAVTNMP